MNSKENKTPLEIFNEEKESCDGPFYHVMGDIRDPALSKIDNIYAIADCLSIENARKHEKILLILSVLGPAISIVFFLYFEGEIHSMIFLCAFLVLLLFLIHRYAHKLECHRKYLEYRVLAEALRVQFFLSIAGIKVKVFDIIPWFTKKGIPWIEDVLKDLPVDDVKQRESIIYYWILDQKTYHEGALKKAEIRKEKDKRITRIAIVITVLAYLSGVLFELYMMFYTPNIDAHLIRISLKILIGFSSVSTLFIESYYGKMSLSETINDHKRMISLYGEIEKEILEHGETEEIILHLAREFLIENSTWYAYQSKNKEELVF